MEPWWATDISKETCTSPPTPPSINFGWSLYRGMDSSTCCEITWGTKHERPLLNWTGCFFNAKHILEKISTWWRTIYGKVGTLCRNSKLGWTKHTDQAVVPATSSCSLPRRIPASALLIIVTPDVRNSSNIKYLGHTGLWAWALGPTHPEVWAQHSCFVLLNKNAHIILYMSYMRKYYNILNNISRVSIVLCQIHRRQRLKLLWLPLALTQLPRMRFTSREEDVAMQSFNACGCSAVGAAPMGYSDGQDLSPAVVEHGIFRCAGRALHSIIALPNW